MNFSARKKLPFEWNCRGVLVLYGLRGSSILLNTSNFNTNLFGFLHTVPSISDTLIRAVKRREAEKRRGKVEEARWKRGRGDEPESALDGRWTCLGRGRGAGGVCARGPARTERLCGPPQQGAAPPGRANRAPRPGGN